MVAAIGNGTAFAKGRDFAAWLGLVPKQMSTGDRIVPSLAASRSLQRTAGPYKSATIGSRRALFDGADEQGPDVPA